MEAETSYVKEANGTFGSVRRTQARLQGRVTAEGVEDAGESEGRPVMAGQAQLIFCTKAPSGRSAYPNRTFTGWIAPASPGAREQFLNSRWKQVIGDGLRFHSGEARATEVTIAAQVLNRMLDLGRPNSIRVA
jgi:hypothetical protein